MTFRKHSTYQVGWSNITLHLCIAVQLSSIFTDIISFNLYDSLVQLVLFPFYEVGSWSLWGDVDVGTLTHIIYTSALGRIYYVPGTMTYILFIPSLNLHKNTLWGIMVIFIIIIMTFKKKLALDGVK